MSVPCMAERIAIGPRGQGGFTLLEVLVAFALLGGAAVLLLSILSNGLRDVADAERHGEAALHARTLIENAGRMERLRPGARSGTLEGGRYRWTIVVRPFADPLPDPPVAPGEPSAGREGLIDVSEPVLYEVELLLEWGEGRPRERLRTSTLRALYPLPEDR